MLSSLSIDYNCSSCSPVLQLHIFDENMSIIPPVFIIEWPCECEW